MNKEQILALWLEMRHGDKEHQRWLRDTLINWFNSQKPNAKEIFEGTRTPLKGRDLPYDESL